MKIDNLSQYSEYVALTHDQIFSTVEFDFSTCVFAVEYMVTSFQYHLFVFRTVTGCNHFTFQGFFFCSSNIGQSDMVYLRRYSLGVIP